MSCFCYNKLGDTMISFTWNNVKFAITDIGGGSLGEDIPRHAHSANSYELHFITGGHGTLVTDKGKYNLVRNNFFITGPGVYHAQFANQEDRVEDVFLMLQVVNAKKTNVISSVFLNNYFCFLEEFDVSLAEMLLAEYRSKYPDYKSAVMGLTIKLLADITRRLLPNSFSDNISEEELNDRRFVLIEQAFLYSKDLTLSQLAGRIGVCERQTQRLLKKYYGKSFREKKKESENLKI